MITMKELNPHNYSTTPEIEANLQVLFERINKVRTAYSKPMIVTSGLRSGAQQQDLIAKGISTATKSNHLTGRAVDIYDVTGELYDWTRANQKLMEEIGLWMEERQGPWQHYQIVPPKSGKRWFKP